jgi:hypothetical protein
MARKLRFNLQRSAAAGADIRVSVSCRFECGAGSGRRGFSSATLCRSDFVKDATGKKLEIKAKDPLLRVLPRLSYRATRPEFKGLMPLQELPPEVWQPARAKAEETLA